MRRTNETHDPALTSWVESANVAGIDFPVQNLPFGVFRRAGTSEGFRGGVAIGAEIVDLRAAHAAGAFDGIAARAALACEAPVLNAFMAMGPDAWSALRLALSRALRAGSPLAERLAGCLIAQAAAEHAVPAQIGDYTDFYTSIHHATNIGRLFRPDNPLLPNYKWVPIGYHGRGSSIAVSGQQFPRPLGQTMAPGAAAPMLGPSRRLDYELELGAFVGAGNALGTRIAIDDADSHVFGLCLLNDWSARDVQAWEYQPLGPFLSKSFATTVSPWIVTLEALAPYRVSWSRPAEDPQPLPYLESEALRQDGAFDIRLEVLLETATMRASGRTPSRLSSTSYRHAYWTLAQIVAHHTVNGCNLQPGD
ncbi:MAG: fumarylacetoacetase, partial [Betaproteobacteria bacterium]